MGDLLADALFACTCHLCNCRTYSTAILCPSCEAELAAAIGEPRPVPAVPLPTWCFADYGSLAGTAVKTGKYRPSARLVAHLAALGRQRLAAGNGLPAAARPEVLVPAPMHPARERQRGFNQAAELAAAWGEALGIPVVAALARIRPARPQSECDEAARQSNLDGVIVAAPHLARGAFRGRRVALVDDVTTTGTTLRICAAALAPLEPARVTALVLASQPRHHPRPAAPPPGG